MGGDSSAGHIRIGHRKRAPSEGAGELQIPSAEAARLSAEDERAMAAERDRAARVEVRHQVLGRKTDLRLDTLESLAKTRNYDRETPELINRIKPDESPEKQLANLDALEDVSTVMLAILFKNGHAADIDLTNFNNVQQLGTPLAHIDPRAAENAALHKLREFSAMSGGASASEFINVRWPRILTNAKDLGPSFAALESLRIGEKPAENEHWVKKFARENPKTAAIAAIAGGIGLCFAIRGVFRWLTGSDEQEQKSNAPAQAPSRWSFATGKGTLGVLGLLLGGGVAAWAFGRYIGFDKAGKWIKENLGFDLTGGPSEFEKNKALYTDMAKKIGDETVVPIDAEFLSDLGDKKYSDVVEEDGLFTKYLLNPAMDIGVVDKAASFLGLDWTSEKRKQTNAVRWYLNQHKDRLSGMNINGETTLAQVLAFLHRQFTGGQSGAPGTTTETPGQTAGASTETPAAIAERTESNILPYLEQNYGEIGRDEYKKIAALPYAKLIATGESRATLEELGLAIRGAGAEAGLVAAPTEEDEKMLQATNILRRFMRDRQALIGTLTIPVGASVGDVLAQVIKAEGALKPRDVLSKSTENQLTDKDIEGVPERDRLARALPADKLNLYNIQRRKLAELFEDDEFTSTNVVQNAIATARSNAKEIRNHRAFETSNRNEYNKQLVAAAKLEDCARNLEVALERRTQYLTAYTATVRNNAPGENISEAFMEMLEKNAELSQALGLLETSVADTRDWKDVMLLGTLQLPRVIWFYARAPERYKNWTRRYYGMILPILSLPTGIKRRIKESLTRPKGGSALLQTRISEGESRLFRELGGGDASGGSGGTLASRAEMDANGRPKVGPESLSPEQRIVRQRFGVERELLDHDKASLPLIQKLEMDEMRARELKRMRTRSTADTRELEALNQSIPEQRRIVMQHRIERVGLEDGAISKASEEFGIRVRDVRTRARSRGTESMLSNRDLQELDDLGRRGKEFRRDALEVGEDLLEQTKAAYRRGAPPAELRALKDQFEATMGRIPRNQKGLLGRVVEYLRVFNDERRAIRQSGIRGFDDSTAEKFRHVISDIVGGERRGVEAASSAPLLRVQGGKIKFYTLALTTAAVAVGGLGALTKDEKTSWARSTGQIALDMAPFTGTASDFWTTATGKEMVSKRRIVGTERWLMRPLFGLVGLSSDILLSAGIGMGVRGWLNTIKGGKAAMGTVKMQRAYQLLEREAAKRAVAEAGAGTAGRAVATAGAGAAAETGAKGGIWDALRRFQKAGMLASVGIGVGGMALSLVQSDEMEIPPEIEELGIVEHVPDGMSVPESTVQASAA